MRVCETKTDEIKYYLLKHGSEISENAENSEWSIKKIRKKEKKTTNENSIDNVFINKSYNNKQLS